jgi:aldose 1-epimerase
MATCHPRRVRLENGALAVELSADALVSVTSVLHRGAELLVGPSALPVPYRVHARAAGLTLLHPWANRLHGDRFVVPGAHVEVAVGEGPEVARDPSGAAIHGLAVPGTFTAVREGAGAAVARGAWTSHPAFPFAHRIEVRVAVRDDGIDVVTSLHASDGAAVPVCFGWHPYFALPGGERAEWVLSAPGLPAAPLGERTLDDACPGGTMAVSGGGRTVTVVPDRVRGPVGQLFAPGDRDVVSLEPMTAPTDALRTGSGLRWVQPGGTFSAAFAIELS